nr:helix-hairpin-helix domain-containing protein [Bradyrhizobium australiense]
MAVADTRTVAGLLPEHAQRTALRGGNPYRAKAYSRAADSLSALTVPLHVLIEEDPPHRNSRIGGSLSPTASLSCIGRARIRTWRSCGRRSRPASWRC